MGTEMLVAYYLHTFQLKQDSFRRSQTQVVSEQTSNLHVSQTQYYSSAVPSGASRVPMLSLVFKAGCEADVRVSDIALRRTGPGDKNDIAAVYAVSDGVRVSGANPIQNKDGRFSLRLRSFEIDACEERKIDVLLDFKNTSAVAGIHRIGTDGLRPVTSSVGSVSVTSNKSLISDSGSRFVGAPPSNDGDLTVSYPSLTSRIKYGDRRRVGRIRLTADGSDSHLIRAIRIKNTGTASDEDLRNIFLADSRSRLRSSVQTSLDGKYVRMTFDPPIVLSSRKSLTLNVYADVRSGRSSTVGFRIEEPSDIESYIYKNRR